MNTFMAVLANFGLLGIGFARLGATGKKGTSTSGGLPSSGVALKADFSDPNANEAWVFW